MGRAVFLFIIILLLSGCYGQKGFPDKVSKDEIIEVYTEQQDDSGHGPAVPELGEYDLYDVHEQIQAVPDVPKFLDAMNKAGVNKIVLLGSPDATFSYIEGFTDHHVNNEQLMQMAELYPGRFIIFPTIDPRLEGELDMFKDYIERGAAGLRLFSGQYAWFYRHIGPINRTELDPVYAYCEENAIPVMLNMNPPKENLQAEFEDVLRRYPNLKVVCPHFCLSSIASDRLEYLMDTYPNLYTDISFGHFFYEGFKRISDNAPKFSRLVLKYQDRMLFGTDMVVTRKTGATSDWMHNLTMCYRDMLEKQTYDCDVHIGRVFDVSMQGLNGLNLDEKVLKKIYHDNPKKWMGIS